MPAKGDHDPDIDAVDCSRARGRCRGCPNISAAAAARCHEPRQRQGTRRLSSRCDKVLSGPVEGQSRRHIQHSGLPAGEPDQDQPCLSAGPGEPRPIGRVSSSAPRRWMRQGDRARRGLFVLNCQRWLRGAAFDMFGQTHPRLRQRKPQRLVLIVSRPLRHGDTFLGVAAMIERRPHDTPPGKPNDDRISVQDYGSAAMVGGRNSGERGQKAGGWNRLDEIYRCLSGPGENS